MKRFHNTALESAYQLPDEGEISLLRDYLIVFCDIQLACKEVSYGALISSNLLRLKFQKDIITIADLYMGWQALIDNYDKMAADNEGLPKGNMARAILSSLIKRKPCVEPVLDGRSGGACVLQKFV